jgi:hypothetical protein
VNDFRGSVGAKDLEKIVEIVADSGGDMVLENPVKGLGEEVENVRR